MAVCPDGQETVGGVCPPAKILDIHCIPDTTGMPDYTPADDQVPFAFDEDTGILWLFICTAENWVSYDLSLCRLSPVDVDVIANLCDFLNIPVVFDNLGVCVEGTITLDKLTTEVANCLGYEPPTAQPVVLGDGNTTTVVAVTVGDVITYTVSSGLTQVTEGEGIDITGVGSPGTPLIVSIDLCELPSLTVEESDAASDVKVAACVDGANVLIIPASQGVAFDQDTIFNQLTTKNGDFFEFIDPYEIDVSSLPIGPSHNEVEIVALLNVHYELITTTCTFGLRDTNANILFLASVEVANNAVGPDEKRDTQRTWARIVDGKINVAVVASNPDVTLITATGVTNIHAFIYAVGSRKVTVIDDGGA